MKNIRYSKSTAQVNLERTLHVIKNSNLTINMIYSDSKYTSLKQTFYEELYAVIQQIVREKSIYSLLISASRSYGGQYYEDLKMYDTALEAIDQTFIKLHTEISKNTTKTDKDGKSTTVYMNRGRLRLDMFLDDVPETFVQRLRWFIRNNIVKDLIRRSSYELEHIECDTTAYSDSGEENEEINKIESIKYNKYGIVNTSDFADDVCYNESFEHGFASSLFEAVLHRFGQRKPVAAFIYLLVMSDAYDTVAVVNTLRDCNSDFNLMLHALIHNVERTFNADLSAFDNTTFNADKYLQSLRNIDDKSARNRIDRLKSTTCKDVLKLSPFEETKKKHISCAGKHYCIY